MADESPIASAEKGAVQSLVAGEAPADLLLRLLYQPV